jgi:protein-tyrosine phosphatase
VTTVLAVNPLDPVATDRAALEAAAVLARGGIVALPTETLYGLAARAGLAHARARLGELSGRGPGEPSTWHAEGPEVVRSMLRMPSHLHNRVVDRLTPGPVRIEVERAALGVGAFPVPGIPEGVTDLGGVVSVRVPSHAVARAVLRHAGGPVVVDRAPGDGRRAPGDVAVDLVLDAGPATHGVASTPVRLTGSGASAAYAVLAEGAVSARAVHRRIVQKILFVCTGNTCRSPMAAAIARARIERLSGGRTVEGIPVLAGVPTEVASAGVSASDGEPASPQTAEGLRAVGVDPPRHRSRPLTAAEAAGADLVYAMTRSHARAVLALAPGARVELLDPAGADIPDPVGGSAALYISTARRLDALIEGRLRGVMNAGGPP